MFAGILLCIQLMLLLIMHIPAVKRYGREFSKPLSGEFRVLIFPAALFLLDLAGHKYSSFYERKLKVKLGELGGGKNINVCIRLFIGWKLTLLWIAVMGLTASAAVVEVDSAFLVFGVLISAVAFILPDRQLENRIKKRRAELQREFPEFINKLILLVDAGMSVRAAIQRIVERSVKDRVLIMELAQTLNEIASGKPEIKAYEDFAKRCRLQDISAFSSALIQNLRKGNDELVTILKLQAATCWQNRKNAARKTGEEASSRLLLPLFITFIAILIMLMTPAIMQMRI